MRLIPTTYESSFASHERSKCWSSRNERVPRNVCRASGEKFWFDCDVCNHSFQKNLDNIQKGVWCPYCTNQKLCEDDYCIQCKNNSFASHEKSHCWSQKNGDITSRQVFKSSNKKYWLDCDKCPHSFETKLSSITNGGWCPYCSSPSKQLCEDIDCMHCKANSFASHEKSQHWSQKNGEIIPRQVFKSSSTKKYWFDCNKCSHSFDAILSSVTNGTWCPYCTNQILCADTNCMHCEANSFASHEKSYCWSQKNGDITPRDVFKSTGNKYWFDCSGCHHLFQQCLASISSSGRWCMYCSNTTLCNDVSCQYCWEHSFASHTKCKYWSPKNKEVLPRQVFKSANKKYWFDCDKCSHSFDITLNAVTVGGWCPYCSTPPKQLCDSTDCDTCFRKSFASHTRSQYWSSRNKKIPRQVFKSSGHKYWFDCENCTHSFEMTLNAVTSGGRWCAHCKYKTERKLYETLLPLYPTIIREFKQDWCKNIKYLPFDFCLPDINILIELDGPQHFRQVSNWTSPEKTTETDKYKEQCANANNYSVIRILQEDVWLDKYDWLQKLCSAIEDIKCGGDIMNLYLCEKNEYNDHV